MIPVASIENARLGERARARAIGARRTMRGSLAPLTLVLACVVGVIQTVSLFAIHRVLPPPPLVAAVIIVLASLGCLWVGTFAFARLVTGRGGLLSAVVTTILFYALALPLGTDDIVLTVIGLVPAALLAAPVLVRLPWPPDPERPSLPCA